MEIDLDKKPVAEDNDLGRNVPTIDLGDPASIDHIANACRE